LPRDQSPKTSIPPCTGTIQPIREKTLKQEDLSPSRCCPSKGVARTILLPNRRTNMHIHSLTLLNKLAAGIRSLDLVRSDMQQIRADAPNPDSRFKEHFVHTLRCRQHTAKLA
jgi:hypothetical protein